MWPGSPSGSAGANGYRALGQAGDDVGLLSLAEVDPGEVGVGVGGGEAERAQALLDPQALGDRASTRRVTSSWCRIASAPAAWARALTLKGWRTASIAARNLGEPSA